MRNSLDAVVGAGLEEEMDELKRFEISGPSMIIDADSEDEARQKYMDLLDADELDVEEME